MREESNTTENFSAGITITSPWRLLEIKTLPNYRLAVIFIDGLHGYVDISGKIFNDNAGVFAQLKDPKVFKQAYLEYGVITWPNGIDIAPDAMYDEIKQHGEWKIS